MACALPTQAPNASPREVELNGGFTIARLKYTGGGDWYSDETSLRNLLRAVKERGEIRVSQDQEAVVTPSDPEIWNYPMLFMTGHGNVKMSEEEARALRSYLDAGGILWADDNFGMDKSFREVVKRLYPEAPLTELPFSHAIFRYPNSFPAGAPKIHEHDGGPARVFGVVRGVVCGFSTPSTATSGTESKTPESTTTRPRRGRPRCASRSTSRRTR